MTWFASPADAGPGSAPSATSPTPPSRRRPSSPARSRSRCSSRVRPAWARPSSPRRSRGRPAPSWSGCSATRGSTRRGRCTSGTTRSSCCASRLAGDDQAWDETHDDIFTEEFLLTRPLLTAIRREQPTVLLIDEIDKADVEVEGLLLEVLSDFQVTIPELGTIAAVRRPFVVLTSNATRELSEALKRRCLYLHLDYPTPSASATSCSPRCPTSRTGSPSSWSPRSARLRDAGAEEGAVDRRDDRLGAHPARAGDPRPRRGGGRRHPRRRPQARLRPGRARSRSSDSAMTPVTSSGLLDRHIAFLEALRGGRAAGLARRGPRRRRRAAARRPGPTGHRRATAYAATLVKRPSHRPTFDTLFDLYFPRLVGDGVAGRATTDEPGDGAGARQRRRRWPDLRDAAARRAGRRRPAGAARGSPPRWSERFGAMPGRGPGLSVVVGVHGAAAGLAAELVDRIVAGAARRGPDRGGGAARVAGRRIGGFTRHGRGRRAPPDRRGEGARARRRRRGPADASTSSTSPPRAGRPGGDAPRDLPARPAAGHPAHPEHHARRRGPLDFRRTVRASLSTGGVPLTTHHKPKRPHRTELVVLCDASGSVANFAQFTLLLVYALREQFAEGARVRVHRPRARGHPVLRARAPTSVDAMSRPRREHRPRRAVGPDQLRPRVRRVRRASTATRSGRSRRC